MFARVMHARSAQRDVHRDAGSPSLSAWQFVRVEHNSKGWRVETCPISGTIRRGRDALEDAENIKKIISDKKEESELTMCTDVDRNDKSRICVAGSVQVIGRWLRLIHPSHFGAGDWPAVTSVTSVTPRCR